MDGIEFVQYIDLDNNTIINPKIDGENKRKLEKHMLIDETSSVVSHIFTNAYKTLNYLVNPNLKYNKLNKVLCLGKVQSGKTAFFIASIALAFDNGYNLAYVIGGTKTKLKDQNFNRISEEFKNNENVKIIDINQKDHENPKECLEKGYKVIIVALKNISSESANLGKIEQISCELSEYPSIVVDDEGDECSPGAPKLKKKNSRAGRTHDVLIDILNNIKICTFLSVTATPQANFLISTIDELSPDFAILVEPGAGYTGGNAFHDFYGNPHVIEILDSDNFITSIPDSFISALHFFIFSILTLKLRGNNKCYSMLVHPSSLTKVHSMVSQKIIDYFESICKVLSNPYDFSYDEILMNIFESGKSSVDDYLDFDDFKLKTIPHMSDMLNNIAVYEFNVSSKGKQSIYEETVDDKKYKIYVGGNMLGRGLTIKNLIVTYMYRDSKISQIDTLYQRARWFGYKEAYFDLCRVYMTRELKYKFIDTVENENDMWNAMNAFLLTKTNIKSFPRIFSLNNDKLRLTRTSIAKTVVIERVNPGYEYDKSIYLSQKEIENNRKLYKDLFHEYFNQGYDKKFGSSENQHHFIIEMKFTEFYEKFLLKYIFPKGSNFGHRSFEKILELIKNGVSEDNISVVYMRYKSGQFRAAISNNTAIKELPQSYDNDTGYSGDKSLPGLMNILHIQLHAVYIDKNKPGDIIPVIAFNNPITKSNIRYVTGDNYYGEI